MFYAARPTAAPAQEAFAHTAGPAASSREELHLRGGGRGKAKDKPPALQALSLRELFVALICAARPTAGRFSSCPGGAAGRHTIPAAFSSFASEGFYGGVLRGLAFPEGAACAEPEDEGEGCCVGDDGVCGSDGLHGLVRG